MDGLIPEFGRNAAYIWACYGAGAAALGALALWAAARVRRAKKRLESLEAGMGARTRPQAGSAVPQEAPAP